MHQSNQGEPVTNPPQGTNQFGQPGAPAGGVQPPPPGQPQQGAYPPPPAPGSYPAPGGFPPPAPPKRSKKRWLRIGIPVVVILIAVVAAIATQDDSKSVKAGDCIQNTGSDSDPKIKQRDCTDSNATYKVLKKISGSSSPQVACANVANTTAGFYETENGDSFVLCLGENH